MHKVLFAWIGRTDLKSSQGLPESGLGPIGQAVGSRTFSHVVLISNYSKEEEKTFITWLKGKTSATILKYHVELASPTDFKDIYAATTNTINDVKKKLNVKTLQATYHLSPGTPAMASVWIILAKTSHPAELIESSREKGLKTVSLPFDISAEYIPDILKPSDDEILALTQGLSPESPEFGAIIHRCKEMKRVIAQSRRFAVYDVPVLIQGESGTGKELFARAIHTTSSRQSKTFIAVNCGSIPQELVESEFFGHKKGSFTGAAADREGYFAVADGGTLFLDEIGELPLPAQVKLLRAIQESKITRIGDSKPRDINIRIIAATNRNLIEDVASGRFREDLLHRIAVGVLNLPPLRVRQGDLNLSAAMALRDRAAVLPMSPDADRARLLSDLSADLDRVEGEFRSLRADPALQDASAEIDEVLLSLTDLRGAIQAQVGAGAVDEELVRQRIEVLDGGLQRFRERLAPPGSPGGRPA